MEIDEEKEVNYEESDASDDVVFEESNEEGAELSSKEQIKKLKEQIKALQKEKAEYLEGWQRARADYANLQKQSEDDRKRIKLFATQSLIEELIPVVDSFLMAMANKEAWEKVEPAWRTGVEYIYNQLMNMLESHNLVLFGEAGETFDPARHEAVSEEETGDESQDHTIAKVIQKGFLLGESVLRPARVVVFTHKE